MPLIAIQKFKKNNPNKPGLLSFCVSLLNLLGEHGASLVCSHNIFSLNQICHLSGGSRQVRLVIFCFLKLLWFRLEKIRVVQWNLIKKISELDISQWALKKFTWGSFFLKVPPKISGGKRKDANAQMTISNIIWLQGIKRELSFPFRVLKEIPSLYVREVSRELICQENCPGSSASQAHTRQLVSLHPPPLGTRGQRDAI